MVLSAVFVPWVPSAPSARSTAVLPDHRRGDAAVGVRRADADAGVCATLLKPAEAGHPKKGFFGWFNRSFDRGRDQYLRGRAPHHRAARPLAGDLCRGDRRRRVLFVKLPTSFLPNEDQGFLFVQCRRRRAPPRSAPRFRCRLTDYLLKQESAMVRGGLHHQRLQLRGRGQSQGMAFGG